MKNALAAKIGPPPSDNDDAPLVPPPAPKPGFLPTGLSRAITIAAVLGCITVFGVNLLQDRYTMIPSNNQENSIVFRLDKRTGVTSICTSASCRVLSDDGRP
jgi:hypothetical protein